MSNHTLFESWTEPSSPAVALYLKQKLLPLDGEPGIIFPPTYAGTGKGESTYSLDSLPDGTKVAQVDSVGSQANRMEPLFKSGTMAALVPQIEIAAGEGSVSLLDVGHRLADALVRCSDGGKAAIAALSAFQNEGNALPIAKLAPTSLVFGAWDSRDAGVKLPRLVQAVIRAFDVAELSRRAQYWPPVDYEALGLITEEDKKKAEADNKSPASRRGFVPVPVQKSHGGIVVNGGVRRDVVINLVALRSLKATDDEASAKLRHYVLGLALAAATAPMDCFLRQGCILTPDPEQPAEWEAVARDGSRRSVPLTHDTALAFAAEAAGLFGVGENRAFTFDKALAKKDLAEAAAEEKKSKKKAKSATAEVGSED